MSDFLPQERILVILTFSRGRAVPGNFFDTHYILFLFLCALTKACTEKLLSMRKNAYGLANVQAFEEYRKMQVEFKKSIQVQNESVDQSTAASAMAAGYMRQGSRFVKQAHGTASFGAVDAYSYFDADHHLDQALRESGFADKSGEDLVRFLEHASDVETETYFYVQKLALQAAFEKILGRGGDKGEFARWVGDPPPDMASQAVTKAAGSAFSANMFERGLAIDMATAGSGELGSGSTRPGGAPAGFYVQMKWMDGWVQQEQNRRIADRQAGMNAPVWDTITDLLDPLIGMGYYQQMGRLENGPSTTQVAQASLMNLTSSLMKIGGAVMVVAGVATGWTGLGIGLAAGGAALIYAGNAIQADMKTGETSFKLTEAGAINATVSVGLSAAGAYFAGGTATLAEEAGKKAFEEALKTGATQAAAETAKAKAYEEVVKAAVLPTAVKMGGLGVATGAASAGLQYNSQQQLVGYKLGGKGTDAAFATAAMGGVASGALAYLGGSAFGANSSQFAQVYGNATMGFLGSKVGSDLASYATRQIYGAEYSSYDMLGQTGDWSGLVGLAGAWAQAANQQNQQQRARDTMNGAAYVQARREQGGYTPTEADITRATDEATAIALSQGLGKGKWNDVNNGIRSLVNLGMEPASAAAAVLQGMGVDLRNVNPSAVQASYNLMHKEQQQALATAAWNKLSPEQQAAVFAGDPYNMTDARTGLPAIGGVGVGTGSGLWTDVSSLGAQWQAVKDYIKESLDSRMGGYSSTALYGYRFEATHIIGAAHGGGVAIYYNGEKYDGSLRSIFIDAYDWSFYGYTTDQRGIKYEASLEAARLPGIKDRVGLEEAKIHSLSGDFLFGYTPYLIENPSQSAPWSSVAFGHGGSIGWAYGGSYSSPNWNYTINDFSQHFTNSSGLPPIPPVYFTALLAAHSDNTLKTYKWEEL